MKVDLLYGKSVLTVSCPAKVEVTVVRKPLMPTLDNPGIAVSNALAQSVGCDSLQHLTADSRSACILICDVTRPVPNHLFLRPLIETLIGAGISSESITVLVATGLHRPNEDDELASVIGDDWVLNNVSVVNHNALDDKEHTDLGFTSRATPVGLDRRFVEADLGIATGLVEPHFMAGYSGGRKVVVPGIAHADTIRTLHSARFMEDPATVQCNLKGNPLHEEQLEIIEMLKRYKGRNLFALNTVINDARQLSFVNFGEIVASHLEAVAFADRYCTVSTPKRFTTVVTSAAGFPLDQTYYQTVKGMVNPMGILAKRANLIIASECAEGLGSSAYRASQERLLLEGPDAFRARILSKSLADIDEWETEMQLKSQRRANIKLYTTGLTADERALTGVEMIESVDAAIEESVRATGDPAVAIIPEGPYVVPHFQPQF